MASSLLTAEVANLKVRHCGHPVCRFTFLSHLCRRRRPATKNPDESAV
jgi:hypothetical protein